MPAGTNARRIAVHFWPALTVISVTSCVTYRSNSGVPGPASGPRIEQLSESASALNRTERPTTTGCARSCRAVAADPVNDTRSCSVRWSNRSPALPQTSCTEPAGSRPESAISSTSRSVRYAVWLAGLIRLGTPARKAGASFSSGPQTGKLKALTCTATPRREVMMCCAGELTRLAERLQRAVDADGVVRQLAPGLAGVAEQHADAAVDVELGVGQRRAGPGRQRVQLVAVLAEL